MNKQLPPALAVVLAMLASGCSQTPEYLRPVPPIPGQWPEGAQGASEQASAQVEWSRFYPDPRLRALVTAALEHNRDMVVATAQVAAARAQYGVQKADQLPTLNLGVSQTGSRVPGDLSSTGESLVSRRYDVDLGVSAFELDFWGRVASLKDAALASYLATDEAQKSFRLSLISDVADAYLTLLEMTERLVLARQTLESRVESRKLIGKRREVGLAGDLDYLAADAAYQAALGEVASLERQRAAANNSLNLLVGTMPPDLPAGLSLAEQGLPTLSAGLPAEVLLKRPDVLSAEQSLMAANANVGAARAAFFPRISLTGSFGTASRELSGLFDSGSRAWSFQPSLTLPLFDWGRTRANVDLAEARKVIAVAQYEKAIQQAFREVADLLVSQEQLRLQLDAQAAAEKSQGQRLKIVEARYQGGVASYLELLDAQREFVSAQQGVVQLRRQWLSASNQLYKALGGG